MKIGFVAAAFAAALAVSAPAFAAEGGAEYTRLSANASSSVVVAQAEGVTTFRSADANGGGGELRRSADAQGGSELRTFAEAGAGGLQRIADAGEAQHVG